MESSPLLTQSAESSTHHPPFWHRCSRLVTIEPVQFLFSLYYAGSIPLVSQFVRNQMTQQYNGSTTSVPCGSNHSDSTADRIQSETLQWMIYLTISAMVPAFFTTILLGGYSDHVGRKIALIPPLIGSAVRLLIFCAVFAFELHVGFLIVASVLDGLGGGICAMLMAVYAYVSDTSSQHQRSTRVVILEFCSGVAIVVSHLTIGYFIYHLGYLWTFVLLLGIIFLTLLYVVFLLPDTEPSVSAAHSGSGFFTVEHFTRMVRLYTTDEPGGPGRRWQMLMSVFIVFLVSAIQLGRFDVQTMFMLAPPLCFTSVWIGYFYADAYLVMNVTSIFVTHTLVHRVGDLVLIIVGLIFGVMYEVLFGLSTTVLMLFMSPLAGCASLLPIALVRAYTSKIVQPDEMGSMFASIAWLEMVGILIGAVMQNSVMAATSFWLDSFVFFLDASLYMFTAILVIVFVIHQRLKRPTQAENNCIPEVM